MFARDYDCWKTHLVNDDYTSQAWSNPNDTYYASVGWKAVDERIGNYIKNITSSQSSKTLEKLYRSPRERGCPPL